MQGKRSRITPVILAGGQGTRLWPLSRAARPKQFLPLLGDTSTFRAALLRAAQGWPDTSPVIVAGLALRDLILAELTELGIAAHLVLEPVARDSGPAIAAAAMLADPGSLLLVTASDHLITDDAAFHATVLAAENAAKAGHIVTFGITPHAPATGFGYIARGEALDAAACKVARFIEKPEAEKASQLLAEGCLWNSGNFLFQPQVLLAELGRFQPAMATALRSAVNTACSEDHGSCRITVLDAEAFASSPALSIDYAVMEHTGRATVVPATYGWSDLGSWHALWQASPKDDSGNAAGPRTSLSAARNSLAISTGPQVFATEVADLAIIATPDAVLVAPHTRSDGLKALVAGIAADPALNHLVATSAIQQHSWGRESLVHQTEETSITLLHLAAGKSVRRSFARIATVIVAQGEVQLCLASGPVTLSAGNTHTLSGGKTFELKTADGAAEIVEVLHGLSAPA